LLLLIDYICRHLKKNAVSISADLAHSFVSKLRKRDCPTTMTEPLCLLCTIGVLRKIRPAVFAHIKTPAVYCFADPYCKNQIRFEVTLPPKLASKRKSAKRLKIANPPVVTIVGKAFWDVGHAAKDQSNRKSHQPGHAAWEIHPVMKLDVQ